MSDKVLAIVDQSNQRGGRMLSIIDLVETGTMLREQCAWMLDHILNGGSWLVGARPGGAGKTTIMSAFLAMLPADTVAYVARPGTGWERAQPGECVVAYELSPGGYDGYVWDDDVRVLCELGVSGCRIVSNLHADTLDEVRSQVVGECGATEEELGAFDVFMPITLSGGFSSTPRTVDRLVCHAHEEWHDAPLGSEFDSRTKKLISFIDSAGNSGLRSCEEVREAWLAWTADNA